MTIDLFHILDSAGVTQLREGLQEVHGSCPGHYKRVGHIDRHPSWSINKNKLTHLCFSCGYKGTLTQLLTDLGHPPSENLELDLRTETFLRRMADQAEDPEQILAPILSDWALINLMHDVPARLLELRNLVRDACDAYGVRWDAERKCWVLPIRDPYGTLLGAQYRQKGNVYTDPEGMSKSGTLFGLSSMCEYENIVLVESPLDSVRLYGLGIPSVAALGSWVSDTQASLLARNFAITFLALDNDKAGQEGAERLAPAIRRCGGSAVQWHYGDTDAKDIGDVEFDEEILAMWESTRSFGLR